MQTGMLWFDNDQKRALTDKIDMAVDYYTRKYGIKPDTCLVHPSALPNGADVHNGISIEPNKAILVGHLWIGKE